MKTLILHKSSNGMYYKELIGISLLLLLFFSSNSWLRWLDATAALLDPGIGQLLLLAVICFLGFTALSHWLLQRWWQHWGLLPFPILIRNFNNLTLWQQTRIYWASFYCLLLVAVLCLLAIF